MLDKKTLNNEIVAMRKVVKQAKVQVIHRLSREIKNLRTKEGSEELKSKCNGKADRRKDDIFAIKKLKPDEVSKFALKNFEDPVKKIGDARVSVELRAYFRLAASRVLSARVNAFREQHPDWKDCIYELLDGLGARRKNLNPPTTVAKEVNPPQTPTHQNASVVSKTPQNKQEDKNAECVVNRVSSYVKDNSININGKRVASGDSATPVKKSRLSSQWSVTEIEPVSDQVSQTDSAQGNDLENVLCEKSGKGDIVGGHHKHSNQFSGVKKSSGIAEVKRFHELCEVQEKAPENIKEDKETDEDDDEGNSNDDSEEDSADGKAVDPFFVKPDGKTEYVTKMVVEEEEGDDDDERGNSPPFARGRKQFRGGRGQSERGGRGHGDRGGRGGVTGFRGGRGSFSDRGQARRGRGAFEGEKTWGEERRRGHDRGRRGNDIGSRFSGGGESGRGRSNFAPKKQDTPGGEHLHPSWEAKRKLKEQSISSIAFQGKKIKFDDDD
ncbi:serum response factor-binding protein 1-like [Ischnura elegans]|uniref:serum response factor-binding protein 1-like n=1 Tax=Ischnura elegans TaxID=197161 RepID=UPI001ED87267|nr:serum response factor-binding protein 1-like [Ischnura elegans]